MSGSSAKGQNAAIVRGVLSLREWVSHCWSCSHSNRLCLARSATDIAFRSLSKHILILSALFFNI